MSNWGHDYLDYYQTMLTIRQFASTTPQQDACSIDDICLRAAGYSMPGMTVDGNDVRRVREVTLQAVETARKGQRAEPD